MEIIFQTKRGVITICIGHKTDWFEQIAFILIAREYYNDRIVCHADWIWDSSKLWSWIPWRKR